MSCGHRYHRPERPSRPERCGELCDCADERIAVADRLLRTLRDTAQRARVVLLYAADRVDHLVYDAELDDLENELDLTRTVRARGS